MILESLLELVETLKARIDTHGDQLRQSEALTRYALIDPLLRELGWDTEDPDVVRPEYRVPNNQLADYVLFADRKPAIVIESKKLDEPLQGGKALDQGILYCAHTGSKYFLLTDGRRYELYESGKTTAIISFDLKGSSSAEVCLKALALWRPSVQAGHVAPGHESVLVPHDDSPEPLQSKVTDIPPPPPTNDGYNWEPLTEITEATGRKVVEMQFRDSSRTPLKNWSYLPVEAVRWLMANGMLNASHCPIMGKGPRTSRYLVHTQPVHRDGASFTSRGELNGLYVERHGSSVALLNRTRAIIEHVGEDPAQFSVRFS